MAASMKVHITNFVSGTSDDAPKEISNEINKERYKFLEFVEDLGESLTNVDSVARGRATQLMGEVMRSLPTAFLNPDQVELVATFLIAKLSDHHSVQPLALQALAVMTSRCPALASGLPQLICQSIFREVQNQSLAQGDRYATYTIIQNLLGGALSDIKQMGGDFVIGFIQQMDSEKDPRNLLIAFSIAQFISSNIPLGAFAEEMFEVLGCYFPIDFTPPTNDRYSISKQDLVVSLRQSLAATPTFAPFCLPLLLEKMTSDMQSARLDAFMTLQACAPVYGSGGLTEFLASVVSSTKREVLMNISPELVEAAKACLVAVFTAVAPHEGVNTSKDNTISASAVELYQDVYKFLEGPDVSKGCLAFSLLRAVCSSSPCVCCAVVTLALPCLVTQLKKQTQVPVQYSYLVELSSFVQVIQQFGKQPNVIQSVTPQVEALCGVLVETLNSDAAELLPLASQSLSSLCRTEALGVDDDRCVTYLKLIVTQAMKSTDISLRQAVLLATHEVLKCRSNARPDMAQFIKDSVQSGVFLTGEALLATSTGVASFTDVTGFFLGQMACKPSAFSAATSCVSCLQRLLTQHASDKDVTAVMLNVAALPLLRGVVAWSSQWEGEGGGGGEVITLMEVMRGVMRTLAKCLCQGDVTKLWDMLQRLFLEGDMHGLGVLGDGPTIRPLLASSPWQQTRLLALLEGFVEGSNIQWMVESRDLVYETVFGLSLASEDEFTALCATRLVAVMMNKAPLGAQIHWFLEPVIDKTKKAMTDPSSPSHQQRGLNLWLHITKAMECRTHSAAAIFTQHLISLVSDPTLGPGAAQGLGHVVSEEPDVYSPKLHANVSPLYKQRFFTVNLKAIIKGHDKATSADIKQNFLTAISSLTSHLSLVVLKPHLSKLVPLLLSSLRNQASQHTLVTLSAAVSSAPEEITPHLDSLIPDLLSIAQGKSTMCVRVSALAFLQSLASLSLLTVAPHETTVVKGLARCLDDRKRLVRRQAVEARTAWIMMGNTTNS